MISNNRKRVLIDMDSTIVDILTPWIAAYNATHDDDLKIEDVTSWDVHKVAKKGGLKVYDELLRPGFFSGLQPYPGAVDAVRAIAAHHDVYIVTAAGYGPAASEKLGWVRDWLPFLTMHQVVTTHSKDLISADVLIDDAPHNAVSYREAHPGADILGIEHPYNKDCDAFTCLFHNYETPEVAWRGIVDAVCPMMRRSL